MKEKIQSKDFKSEDIYLRTQEEHKTNRSQNFIVNKIINQNRDPNNLEYSNKF